MGEGPHNGKFSIVRHEVLDDAKFENVYDNDNLLATWLRLLIAYDKTWPSPAPIPWNTDKDALSVLVSSGLVDLLPHGQFVMHGGSGERDKRKASNQRYRDAANARWHPNANAT